MSNVYCCEACYQGLKKINKYASRLWVDLCMYHIEGFIYINSKDFKELRILERNGFCLSTDVANFLVVRLNGFKKNCSYELFCMKPDEHEQE